MNPGLAYLLGRLWRGRLRYTLRRVRTLKGAATTLAGAVLLLAIVAWQFFAIRMGVGEVAHESVVRYGSRVMLFFLALYGLNAKGLYLAPQEIDFLLPAPLGRRALLGYLLVSRFGGQLFSSFWVGLYTLPYAPLPLAGVAGVLLGLGFVYLASMLVALLRIGFSLRVAAPVRGRIKRVLGVGVVLGVVALWRGLPSEAGTFERAGMLLDSAPVRVLSLPTLPFVQLFAARDAVSALGWAAASLALLALVVGAAFAVDVPWEERSLELSRTLQQRLDRMRSGHGYWETGAKAAGPVRPARIPRLGFLGRAAPLARRHLLELAHNPRTLLPLLLMNAVLMVGFGGGPAFSALREGGGGGAGFSRSTAVTMLATVMVGPIFTTGQLRLDFRRDLDRMAFLKSLPLPPLAVAAGQIFTVALVFTAMEFVLIGAVAALTRALPAAWIAAALAVVPVLVWCLVALDNTLFLLLPSRPPVPGAGGVMSGRTIGAGLVKYVGLALIVAAAGAAGFLGLWLVDSVAAAAAGAMLALLGIAVLLTWMAGRAFAAFDVNRDVPK